MLETISQQVYPNVDYECLRIYDETNRHFSMALIMEKKEEQEEEAIGYDCLYCYETHRIKLEFNTQNGLWKIVSIEGSDEEDNFDSIFDDVQFFTLDQQIQILIKRFDQHFLKIEQIKNENKQMSIPASIFREEDGIKCTNNHFTPQQLPRLAIPEDDVDYGFHALISGSRSKFSGLAPPPVAPRRSRQNSACSTQSSVRYASFIPPPTAPVRRRRVIASILLHVQKKKKTFENIVDALKGIQRPTMHDLGLEFLRIYDGRFNYPMGHTFVMSFRKKSWFLTIDQINCVDCPVGEIGPRSVLILNYKGQYSTVHV